MAVKDLTGAKFGRLTVVKLAYYNKTHKSTYWECLCDCGNLKQIARSSLISGRSKSCGCLLSETAKQVNSKHGQYQSGIYMVWVNMKKRNKNEICIEWNDFEVFYKDMFEGYSSGCVLTRINKNVQFYKNNCEWMTSSEPLLKKKGFGNSLYKGVWYNSDRNKYESYIGYKNSKIHLGRFDEEVDAAKAYNDKAKELFGEFAVLNII